MYFSIQEIKLNFFINLITILTARKQIEVIEIIDNNLTIDKFIP